MKRGIKSLCNQLLIDDRVVFFLPFAIRLPVSKLDSCDQHFLKLGVRVSGVSVLEQLIYDKYLRTMFSSVEVLIKGNLTRTFSEPPCIPCIIM